jgi:signal transduction histidine kinase
VAGHEEPVGLHNEQFLLRAFRSFVQAADSLEKSYGILRAEVERLRQELEDTQSKLRREQALAEMSGVLAHEIRNPLGSLELFAGLLAESELNEECRQWVGHLQAGLRTLSATVNNVLHFDTAPDAPRMPVDLGNLLEWAGDFLLPLARQSSVTLNVQNQLSGVSLLADRHRLEQVLLNLIINALRALPAEGWIQVSGHRTVDGATACLMVTDNGPGIPAEHLGRIFESGFTTHASSSGLGLMVCRKIVERHRGSIQAENRPGGGARFVLKFPLAQRSLEGAAE